MKLNVKEPEKYNVVLLNQTFMFSYVNCTGTDPLQT